MLRHCFVMMYLLMHAGMGNCPMAVAVQHLDMQGCVDMNADILADTCDVHDAISCSRCKCNG